VRRRVTYVKAESVPELKVDCKDVIRTVIQREVTFDVSNFAFWMNVNNTMFTDLIQCFTV
jgi:hypothetical protein